MDGKRFLKPINKDLIVRDPRSKVPLSIKGEWKPWDGQGGTYWRRRVMDGSAVIAEPDKIVSEQSENTDTSRNKTYKRRGN